jgi:hypothetical protein
MSCRKRKYRVPLISQKRCFPSHTPQLEMQGFAGPWPSKSRSCRSILEFLAIQVRRHKRELSVSKHGPLGVPALCRGAKNCYLFMGNIRRRKKATNTCGAPTAVKVGFLLLLRGLGGAGRRRHETSRSSKWRNEKIDRSIDPSSAAKLAFTVSWCGDSEKP